MQSHYDGDYPHEGGGRTTPSLRRAFSYGRGSVGTAANRRCCVTVPGVEIVAVIIGGPLAVVAGAVLNHVLSGRAAAREREQAKEAARLEDTRRAVIDFLRVHSDSVAQFRKMAAMVETRASKAEALALNEEIRRLTLDMDMATAQVEWVAPATIITAARRASEGMQPAMDLFARVGTSSPPGPDDWGKAYLAWADARRELMEVCRSEFYGEKMPALPPAVSQDADTPG